VDHADLVGLLRGGIDSKGARWADLGAGEGAFTTALADLLGPDADITAVDRDSGSLRTLAAEMGRRFPATRLHVLVADFSRPIALTDLDGIVMANSLHFIRDKRPVLARVKSMIRPGGRLIVVEYGADRGNPWVPHPFSFSRWVMMAAEAGFERTRQIGTVPSRYLGSIYSAVSYVPVGSSADQVS
jgi:ubiquinone/menaquinone biosynthesis C-methylase UbiE